MKAQIKMFKNSKKSYGGILLNTRKGRSSGRPLDTKNTMHLILRSTQATGEKAFTKPKNKKKLLKIVDKFAAKYGIKIISYGINLNHLHFHIKLANRFGYYKFIRAVTSAIAMAISGINRWTKNELDQNLGTEADLGSKTVQTSKKFWDFRPFTRIIMGFRDFKNITDYIQVNQLEGFGANRLEAQAMIENRWRYTARI